MCRDQDTQAASEFGKVLPTIFTALLQAGQGGVLVGIKDTDTLLQIVDDCLPVAVSVGVHCIQPQILQTEVFLQLDAILRGGGGGRRESDV